MALYPLRPPVMPLAPLRPQPAPVAVSYFSSSLPGLAARAVRYKDWKYHTSEVFKLKKTARKSKGATLYNLRDDIGESKNLINDYPEIVAKLKNALQEHNKKR